MTAAKKDRLDRIETRVDAIERGIENAYQAHPCRGAEECSLCNLREAIAAAREELLA